MHKVIIYLKQVNYVSFNPSMVYKLMAHYGLVDPVGVYKQRPAVPEIDFSGTVCELRGPKARDLKPGKRLVVDTMREK
jgi:NADPH:quinone reductase-like Zn-dependent oxidoreductase